MPIGKVAALDPAPGSIVPVGSEVRVSVSQGPPPKLGVPSVTGLTVAQARKVLEEAGFDVSVRQLVSNDSARVVTQFPIAGREVDPGSTVTLFAFP